jgi:GT2 family glycosyltransferase
MAGLVTPSEYPRISDPQIAVSVVTYNNAECLPSFLECLRQQQGVIWEAFFFDNASQDKTAELIRQSALGELFLSGTNLGYGRSHNHNVARSRAKHVLLMNADLQFRPDLFAKLLCHLEEHPEHSLAGPAILEGPDKRPFPPRYFYPGEGMVVLEGGLRRQEIAWLNGCCLMIRRDVFRAVGGFDPDYFLYTGETDFCLRARRAGYRLGYAQNSVVYHLHRQSQRELSDYDHARRIFQGSAVFWEKHYALRDVLDMVRFQYWISGLLLGLSWAQGWLPQWSTRLSEARLRARRDICREWLDRHGHRVFGLAPPKIVMQQCRIAVEWILQRRFPLDDY